MSNNEKRISIEQFNKMCNINIAIDDDELILHANEQITKWQATGTPKFVEVQKLFHESICSGASHMARDKIVESLIAAFGNELGTKRSMINVWNQIIKEFHNELAEEARNRGAQPELTAVEKAVLRENLWPTVRELAEAPDLIDRMVQQVQALGVVNERDLIVLTYIAATSRVLQHPINIIAKGASGSGKSFTIVNTLTLVGSDYVNQVDEQQRVVPSL